MAVNRGSSGICGWPFCLTGNSCDVIVWIIAESCDNPCGSGSLSGLDAAERIRTFWLRSTSTSTVASNPGPRHHRICDRREEGLVKPPFCFGSLPTIVGKISHSNYLAQSAVFKSIFDSQKRRGVARHRLSLSRYKHKANPSSSTPQHGQKRRRGKDEDILVQKSLTLWPPKFTVRSERNVFPSSYSCFLFSLSHVYLSGKTPVSCLAGATPVPHKERRASVPLICLHCSKEGMCILAKQCVSSERCAMPKACSVCHHGNKVEQTQQLQTKLSLQDVGLVIFLNLARRSLFFVKHDKHTDKATNHNDCTNIF